MYTSLLILQSAVCSPLLLKHCAVEMTTVIIIRSLKQSCVQRSGAV